MAAPRGDVARHLAFRAVIRQATRFPNMEPDAFENAESEGASISREPMTALDAAFAHAIYDAAIRRWLTIEYLLNLRLKQPLAELEPRVRGALLAGASQILFMDRVPVHAAIDHAVEWAKVIVRPGAGAMVNAVLRRVSEMVLSRDAAAGSIEDIVARRDAVPLFDATVLRLVGDLLPSDETSRLSVQASAPMALLTRWARSRSAADVRTSALHTLVIPPTVLAAPGGLVHDRVVPHEDRDHFIYQGSRGELGPFLAEHPGVWVQDAASSKAVQSVSDLHPRLIIDVCAGRGTKTRQLAATFPDAVILATDVDAARRASLSALAAHPSLAMRVRVVEPRALTPMLVRDVAQSISRDLDGADLILLDVPCSNTGVLSRRPEAKYRVSTDTISSLTTVQRQIIADAIPLLRGASEGPSARPGTRGAILYSTCSLEPEENLHQAEWAAKWHGFRLARETATVPRGLPGDDPARCRDGSFSILLE
jgi:16S rRNA (cytosine967-C5)-methyltransferase